MARSAQNIRKQVEGLFTQARDQIDDIRDTLEGRIERSRDVTRERIETDMKRLRAEGDKILGRLGEQTQRLANQTTVPLPSPVKRTVNRINGVLDDLVNGQKKTRRTTKKRKTTTKKRSTRTKKKTTRKKSTRKTA